MCVCVCVRHISCSNGIVLRQNESAGDDEHMAGGLVWVPYIRQASRQIGKQTERHCTGRPIHVGHRAQNDKVGIWMGFIIFYIRGVNYRQQPKEHQKCEHVILENTTNTNNNRTSLSSALATSSSLRLASAAVSKLGGQPNLKSDRSELTPDMWQGEMGNRDGSKSNDNARTYTVPIGENADGFAR